MATPRDPWAYTPPRLTEEEEEEARWEVENQRLREKAERLTPDVEALARLEQMRLDDPTGRAAAKSVGMSPEEMLTARNRRIAELQQRLGKGPFMPSRDVALGAAGAEPGADPRIEADQAAENVRSDRAPRGEGPDQKVDRGSDDEKLPKAGSGPGAELDRPAAARDRERDEEAAPGRARVIEMPDGRKVLTNVPEVEGIDADAPLYAQGIGRELPSEAGVVSGAGGTIYTGDEPIEGMRDPLPQDRSPGWATRAAHNELYRRGELSMDPVDIADRQRWERRREAEDIEREVVKAQAEAAIAKAELDPVEMAQMEAEARYGGQVIEEQGMIQRAQAAMTAYAAVTERMNEIEAEMADTPAKQRLLERLERERRDYANIIMGFQLRDPKLDPMSMMAGMIGATTAPATTEE